MPVSHFMFAEGRRGQGAGFRDPLTCHLPQEAEGARLNCRVEPSQATCFSAWWLTFSLQANTGAPRSGHVLQRVVVDFQPIRLEVRNHALKHMACAAVVGREVGRESGTTR
jgi:hypothetical protein